MPGVESRPITRDVYLTPEGAAWLPGARAIVIADVHLGYARAARRRGGYLPPIESARAVADRALAICARAGATRLVIAGDVRHSTRDADARELDEVAAFHAMLAGAGPLEHVDLIAGNHDRDAPSPFVGSAALDDVDVTHKPPAAIPDRWTIAGHLHPRTTLRDETGAGIRVPCALVGPRIIVLPAFSLWAGGISVARALRALPPGEWRVIPSLVTGR
ncbi:MAG: hypothetical protein ABJD07_01860 [Gemmatimonadaceae bacterium]